MKCAICAIARLENNYINEWIQHHVNIGIDHIYVYDNSSSEEEKLNSAIYEELLDFVTVIPAYDKKHYQMLAYKEAYYKYGGLYDYIIYIDIDEFIMLQKDETINQFLDKFPHDLECYRMNWELYGDNEIINRDVRNSVVKDFTKPSIVQRGKTTKSIIKTKLDFIDFVSVHYAVRNKNGILSNLKTYCGNIIDITNTLPIDKKSLNIELCDYTLVKLNHYITKSISEFICQKMRRPDAAWSYDRNIDNDFFAFNTKTKDKVNFYNESQNVISYYYWSIDHLKKCENAGDYYNKILMNNIYHCVCKEVNNKDSLSTKFDVAMCGSLLDMSHLKNAKYICGCGFQNSKNASNINNNAYLAVRGNITKNKLLSQGIKINDNIKCVDPGLLVSYLYDFGKITKRYDIGIISHYVDEEIVKKKYGSDSNIKIISMKTTDIRRLCREILQCNIIVSSSLHGIIFSHSLGVPAYHIEITKLQEGDNLKFKDYYSSYNGVILYKNFKYNNGIPFKEIFECNVNPELYNPSKSEVIKKQQEFLSILPFKNLINKKYVYSPNIVVCITSFKDRIHIVHKVIDSIIKQTVKCNIYLTLSEDEFPNKEAELPSTLTSINYEGFHINWVKENIKPFKKSLYTLDLVNDDDIIITIDDDIIYPKDTIQRVINEFNGKTPMSSGQNKTTVGYNKEMYTNTGCLCAYNKKMVNNWKTIINKNIINTNDDDRFMLAMFWLNGYHNNSFKNITTQELLKYSIEIKNDKCLTKYLTTRECQRIARNVDDIISEKVETITHKHLYDSFGYFTKNKSIIFNEKIIITLTSWKKRITNIPVVLDTIFKNTKQPDKIVINLSSEEFANKEKDIPDNVLEYINQRNDKIEINWVDGKNIKSWKKTIPTFKLYPNDCIICIDDDMLYHSTFIETLWKKHTEYPNNPITYATVSNHGFMQHCGCGSLDKACYYPDNIELYLKTDIVNYPDEDSFMTFMAVRNGNQPVSCGNIFGLRKLYNSVYPLSDNSSHFNTAYKWISDYLKDSFENYSNNPITVNRASNIRNNAYANVMGYNVVQSKHIITSSKVLGVHPSFKSNTNAPSYKIKRPNNSTKSCEIREIKKVNTTFKMPASKINKGLATFLR